jgi:CRP/FNR family cyclic AMP-dependent transcriptional regulator
MSAHSKKHISFCQVTNRLARLLIQLPAEQLAGLEGQRLTQDQLAARLGTVREVVARALRELEQSGAIQINRRQIRIEALDVLRSWVQND